MNEIGSLTAPDALGEWFYTRLLQRYGESQERRLQAAFRRVETDVQRTRLPASRFQGVLLDSEEVTAFTAPGPYVYFSQRLQRELPSDDALAFVFAHEIAHHDLGHIAVYQKRLEMLGSLPASSMMALVLTLTERVLCSPERELAADAHGLKLCLSLGYDGERCLETFEVLKKTALAHQDRAIVYGPDSARSNANTEIEQWMANVNTWVWQRTRGYPSLQERKERLQALLPISSPQFQNPTERASLAPGRKPPKMTLDQIDQALEAWRAKLMAAADNLLALDDNLTYKRLEGKGGLPVPQLTGITRQQVTPALEAMHDLFGSMGLLTKAVERATELRKTASRFRGGDATLREIEDLLYGPSIVLPSAQTPLAQRSLLSASETANKITPERLLAVMTESFEKARDAVFAVEQAWNQLEPALGKRETELTRLQHLAEAAGVETLPELTLARTKIERVRTQIETDPLGASHHFEGELMPLLQRVREEITRIVQKREGVVTDLAKARELLTRLEETHQDCERVLAECQEKIGRVAGLRSSLDPARIAELTQWLETLEATLKEGRWQPVCIGLERWFATATEYLNTENAAYLANRAPVELRAELRGRLAALKMKAKARGLTQEANLDAIAEEADRLLHQFPVPLEQIAQLVSLYEARIIAHIG